MATSLRFALALCFGLVACSGSNEAIGTGPVVDDVGSVVKIRTRGLPTQMAAADTNGADGHAGAHRAVAELRVVVSFHDPDGDVIEHYSFVPRGAKPAWRELPKPNSSEGNEVEIFAEADDLAAGEHSFELTLRDDRGREGRPHRVAFTLAE